MFLFKFFIIFFIYLSNHYPIISYTIFTMIYQQLYTNIMEINRSDSISKSPPSIRTISRLSVLGACFKSGQPIKGIQHTPSTIRKSGLFESLAQNYGITVNDHGDIHQLVTETTNTTNTHIENLQILDPSLKHLNDKVTEIISDLDDNCEVLLNIGGDHSIATGTIHALLSKYPQLKVIWVDAHTDIIDASKSSYPSYHGMPVSHLLGINDGKIPGFSWLTRRLKPQNLVYIGIRDIDPDEWVTLKQHNLKCFTPDHIDMWGIGQVMRQALEYLDPKLTSKESAPFHISFDIDAMDPKFCQATGTKYRGGLTPREACHIVRRTCWERKLVSMDLVEINPMLETTTRKGYRGEEKYVENLSETVGMGLDLIQSVFKKYFSL